ncbi:MAG: hypothetical protein AB7D36_00115 [Oscillospiraceae bacterium]
MSTFHRGNARLRICVDSSDGGHISGTVFSQRLIKPMAFCDLGSLILSVDDVLEAQKFPQAFQRSRSFTKEQRECPIAADSPEDGIAAERVEAAHGKLLTFDILVISRRSSSWQGFIDWVDENRREEFFSALEIIRLVDAHLFDR